MLLQMRYHKLVVCGFCLLDKYNIHNYIYNAELNIYQSFKLHFRQLDSIIFRYVFFLFICRALIYEAEHICVFSPFVD